MTMEDSKMGYPDDHTNCHAPEAPVVTVSVPDSMDSRAEVDYGVARSATVEQLRRYSKAWREHARECERERDHARTARETWEEEARSQRADADALRDAARPFVDAFLDGSYPDQPDDAAASPASITVGDYRNLWAALDDDRT